MIKALTRSNPDWAFACFSSSNAFVAGVGIIKPLF
jgi:hypothetical protein